MKKVKCVERGDNCLITVGKVYEVSHFDGYQVWITTNNGSTCFYPIELFEPVGDPPRVEDYVKAVNKPVAEALGGWTNQHYNGFEYTLTDDDKKRGSVRIDPYFVAKQWRLGEKDQSGVLFHNLKTMARFGDKNKREREIMALHAQVKRLAELEGVVLP